jgi:hypothetical protein
MDWTPPAWYVLDNLKAHFYDPRVENNQTWMVRTANATSVSGISLVPPDVSLFVCGPDYRLTQARKAITT